MYNAEHKISQFVDDVHLLLKNIIFCANAV